MTEKSKEEEFSHNLDAIIKNLTYSDLISVFFLLIDRHIEYTNYLCIIKQNENVMKNILKQFFLLQPASSRSTLLLEILFTIKRYNLMKILNVCHHKYKDQCSSLSIEWKSLYEVCESFDFERDLKHFEKILPGRPISKEDHLEVFFVKAYGAQLITKSSLPNLLTELNKYNIKSRTWQLHGERYFIRQPTSSSPCGLAVIINHTNFKCEENDDLKLPSRKDSFLDVDALEKLWKSFGFVTKVCSDYKEAEVLQEFKNLSESDFSCFDVFVACYMSHGKEGVVYSSDCKSIPISQLIDFMADKCLSLIDKPKLFFIQACQGSQIQCGISPHVDPPQPQIASSSFLPQPSNSSFFKYLSNTPLLSDVLVAVSNIPGFASFACKDKNSWFIEALVENIGQFGDQKSFTEVMTKVTNHVKGKSGQCKTQDASFSNCKQTIKTETTFTKSLFLRKVLS